MTAVPGEVAVAGLGLLSRQRSEQRDRHSFRIPGDSNSEAIVAIEWAHAVDGRPWRRVVYEIIAKVKSNVLCKWITVGRTEPSSSVRLRAIRNASVAVVCASEADRSQSPGIGKVTARVERFGCKINPISRRNALPTAYRHGCVAADLAACTRLEVRENRGRIVMTRDIAGSQQLREDWRERQIDCAGRFRSADASRPENIPSIPELVAERGISRVDLGCTA